MSNGGSGNSQIINIIKKCNGNIMFIRVLTYNIYYKAMGGNDGGLGTCNNYSNAETCRQNVQMSFKRMVLMIL